MTLVKKILIAGVERPSLDGGQEQHQQAARGLHCRRKSRYNLNIFRVTYFVLSSKSVHKPHPDYF
jgi:hypothetical protein